jgi:hypothetical protein
LSWAKFGVVPVALAAGIASAIRNVSAVFENYSAAGAHDGVAILAALAFVVSVEVAVFIVALARAGVEMRRRSENRPRHVTSLRTLYRGLQVRLGTAEPLSYADLPERDTLGLVLWLAVGFAVVANLAVALAPMLGETQQPLQDYLAGLAAAPGRQQVTFILDVALALLPPALALVGGELTAKFAREFAQQGEQGKAEYRVDLAAWRAAWQDPLSIDEGEEYLLDLLNDKARRKLARTGEAGELEPARPFGQNGHAR